MEQTPSDLPEWLKTGGEPTASTKPAAPAELDKNDIPEFLRHAGWGASSGAAEQQGATAFEEAPGDSGGEAAVEGELPAWVKALAPAEEDMTPTQAASPTEETDVFRSSASLEQTLPADTPDWLHGLGDQEAATAEVTKPESPRPAAETPALPTDMPDWLRNMGPARAESAAPAAQAPDETPDWLKDLAGHELDEPAAPVKNEAEADWLGSLRAEQQPAAPAEPEESPAWLKDFGNDLETPIAKTEPALETPAPEPAKPEAPTSLGALGTTAQEQDDAMAWLEALAAKHGAKPEELVTDPNARTEAAPEWVDKAKEIGEQVVEAQQPTAEAKAPPAEPVQPEAEDQTGMWLRSLVDAEQAQPAEAEQTQPAEPEQVEVPEPAQPTAEDQTSVWLRGLAEAEQAQAAETAASESKEETIDFRSSFADQAEFIATESEAAKEEPPILAESETPDWLKDLAESPASPAAPVQPTGMEDAPSWLRGIEEEAQAPAEAAPVSETPAAEEASIDLPAWLAGLEKEEEGMAQAMPEKRASEELPAWLQSEVEPEPEAKEPANPADWHPVTPPEPAPAEPAAQQRPAYEEPPTTPLRLEQVPVPGPEPEPVEKEPEPVPAPAPARVEKAPEPVPAPTRPKPAVSAQPKPAAVSLGDAQSQMGRGNIAAALDIYSKLIRKGKSLEEIIRDLRDALYRYPVEVPLWQSLGDAYMRANRLQEALDAYTKAEELLR